MGAQTQNMKVSLNRICGLTHQLCLPSAPFYSLFICLSLFLCILSYHPLPLLSQFHSFTFSPPLSGRVYLFLIKVMSQWVDASRASNTLRQFVSAHVTFQTGSVSLSRVLWTMSHWCPSVLSHYHTSAPFTDNYNEFKQSKKVRHSLNAITGCVRTENAHTNMHLCATGWESKRKMLIYHATRVQDLLLPNLTLKQDKSWIHLHSLRICSNTVFENLSHT